MSRDLNRCDFIGRLGKDIELKFLPNGDAVANFSIACGDDYKDKQGNKVEQTNWINLVAFGKTAEILNEYTSKGSQLYVSTKQRTRKYQAQDGTDRYVTENVINEFQFIGGRDNSSSDRPEQKSAQPARPAPPQSQREAPPAVDDFSDSIPF